MRAYMYNDSISYGYTIDWIRFEKGDKEICIDLQGESSYSPDKLDIRFKGGGIPFEDEEEYTNEELFMLCETCDKVSVQLYPMTQNEIEFKKAVEAVGQLETEITIELYTDFMGYYQKSFMCTIDMDNFMW